MAQLLNPIQQKFTDDNGELLVGGKIYSYEAGTTTPLDTYTDQSGNTANTNPIILDANGEANIWIGTQSYKFVITDANDNVLDTIDNVADLADDSVSTSKIVDGAVTTAKINNSAITTAKINNGAITPAKMAARVYGKSTAGTGSTSSGSDTEIASKAITCTGRPVDIRLEGVFTYTYGGATVGEIIILRNSTTIYETLIDVDAGLITLPLGVASYLDETPPSGSNTYKLVVNSGDGSFAYISAKIVAVEL